MSTDVLEKEVANVDLAGFTEAEFTDLGSNEPTVLRAKREAAFAAYAQVSAPHALDEEYRRTDPKWFGFGKYSRLADLQATNGHDTAPWDAEFDVVVSVSDTGFHIEDQTGVLKDGLITVSTLADAAEKDAARIEKYMYWNAKDGEGRKYRLLTDAFYNFGLFVDIPAKVTLPKGILIRYELTAENASLLPRVLCLAGTQSVATIVEHYHSLDGLAHQFVAHREFYLEAAADLKVISMQDWGNKAIHLCEDWAKVARDAKIDLINISLGSRVSKSMAACDTAEENSNAYLGGLYFADKRQHFDQKTLQIHSAPNTYSNMLYKGAAKDKAYSVYHGYIRAAYGAIGVDSYQTNNNLLLTQGARADSIPGLIIDADDLACSHGATIGNLDPEQYYYLRARGIDALEARKMLVLGFFEEVVQRVPYAPLQDRLHKIIEAKLGV